ncbi:MAG TPA: hypothetical protein PLT55_05130 [Acidimicrobiia bacterium]|nr:hypothetical protein [Acidimicrobiia bacterium]
MSRLNQQLIDLSYQVDELKADLFRSQEQFEAIDDQAEEAKIRAMVSETPDQAKFSHEMQVARDRLATVIAEIKSEIETLKTKQDELLEKLFEENTEN